MAEIVDISALNSRVKFDRTDVPFDQRQILGDATESGLTRFAGRHIKVDYEAYVKRYPKVFEGKFCSDID
jgi:sodium/potassium-transporting ATPase subunit alpha